jgi:hypothetical protein
MLLLFCALLVWFERFLPGRDGFVRHFGEDFVLRLVVGLLCVFTALAILERQQLGLTFRQVIAAFQQFHRRAPESGREPEPRARREALAILLGALGSTNRATADSALGHLRRLTGQDFGTDVERWRAWIDANVPDEPRR